jgi:hypothetical protein
MVQLAGGVTALQLKPIVLDDEAVPVNPTGADGTPLQVALPLLTASIPLMNGWW